MFQRSFTYFFTPLFVVGALLGAEQAATLLLVLKIAETVGDVGAPAVIALLFSKESSNLRRTRMLDLLTLPMAFSFICLHAPPAWNLSLILYGLAAGIYGICYSMYNISFRALVSDLATDEHAQAAPFARTVIAVTNRTKNLGTFLMLSLSSVMSHLSSPNHYCLTLNPTPY